MSLTKSELAKYMDHTLLKADATAEQIDRVAAEARELNTASVCVNGYWVPRVAAALEGTDVMTCAVIGFPLGAMSTAAKAAETAGVSGLGHGRDVGAHHVVVAGLELADVDDHVDLARTGGHHVGGLGGLGGGGHGAQREADDGAGHDVSALKGGGDARHPVAVDAHGGGVELARLGGDAVDLLGGGVRLEQGVVHVLGEFGFGEGHGGSFRLAPRWGDECNVSCGAYTPWAGLIMRTSRRTP